MVYILIPTPQSEKETTMVVMNIPLCSSDYAGNILDSFSFLLFPNYSRNRGRGGDFPPFARACVFTVYNLVYATALTMVCRCLCYIESLPSLWYLDYHTVSIIIQNSRVHIEYNNYPCTQ